MKTHKGWTSKQAAEPISSHGLKVRKALIPQDIRNNTARLMGDPIPNDPRRESSVAYSLFKHGLSTDEIAHLLNCAEPEVANELGRLREKRRQGP